MTAVTLIRANVGADPDRGAWIDCTLQAGEAMGIGDVVRLGTDNKIYKALADSAAHARVYGMITGGVNTPYGETGVAINDTPAVAVAGNVFVAGALINTTALQAGQLLYLSKDTAGGLVDTAPTSAYQVLVARAEGDSQIYIMPGLTAPVSA